MTQEQFKELMRSQQGELNAVFKIRKRPAAMTGLFFCYMFMQLVAPSAVTIAVATDAMICTINLSVSLLVIMFN